LPALPALPACLRTILLTCLPACAPSAGCALQVQAARFLLAGHPFCWNGLSFAHAVVSMAPAASGAGGTPVKQEQASLSELLARHAAGA